MRAKKAKRIAREARQKTADAVNRVAYDPIGRPSFWFFRKEDGKQVYAKGVSRKLSPTCWRYWYQRTKRGTLVEA